MTTVMRQGMPPIISEAMEAVADSALAVEDRAAVYAVLHQIQLRINRALRAAKDDLIVHMESNGLREMGPLSVKATAIDVAWPCNDEGNWADAQVQEAMELYAKVAPEYFRHVPEHWEVRTAALGAGVAEGDPVAKRLHAEMKEHKWRTEAGRRLSLAVREAKGKVVA
jgi:hypothetical protein